MEYTDKNGHKRVLVAPRGWIGFLDHSGEPFMVRVSDIVYVGARHNVLDETKEVVFTTRYGDKLIPKETMENLLVMIAAEEGRLKSRRQLSGPCPSCAGFPPLGFFKGDQCPICGARVVPTKLMIKELQSRGYQVITP